ncbi:PspA/IM30 family protein [Paenibacillus marinisediminis]
MALFKRLRDVTMSNLYALIEKAEDPVKLTDQYLRDMQEDLEEAEKAVAQQIAIEKRFKMQLEEQEALVKRREEQAMLAVEAGNVELARRALEEKKAAEQKVQEFRTGYDQNHTAANNLRSKLDEMRKQYTDMKNKRETLVARFNAAKAQNDINKAMAGFNSDTAMSGLKRMEDKMLHMEAQADASNELNAPARSLDDEFAKLSANSGVEDELAALIRKAEEKKNGSADNN